MLLVVKSKLMFILQHQTVLQSSQLEPVWQKELWGGWRRGMESGNERGAKKPGP
jgi:hypothetical protein